MLQNVRVTAFTVSELLRKNQQGGLPPPSPTQTLDQALQRLNQILKELSRGFEKLGRLFEKLG